MKSVARFIVIVLFFIETIVLILCAKLAYEPIFAWDNFIIFLIATFSIYLYLITVTGLLRLK